MEINLIDTLSIWKKSGEMEFDKLIRENTNIISSNQRKKLEEKMNYLVNISHKHKIVLWLWSKCGTSHMAKVLKRFDFKLYRANGDNLVLVENQLIQLHFCNLFFGHQDYKILAAVRNPYSRFFSDYTFTYVAKPEDLVCNEINKEKFREFIYQSLVYDDFSRKNCVDFPERVPDYPVRLENLYEDYSKIPFIVESDYFKSGELKNDVNKKINVSNDDENLWRKFYTQEIADIIYYRMSRYFELFGYDKNSWKYE
jgi:hypothetical protein